MKANEFCGVLVTILLAILLFGCDSLPDDILDSIDDITSFTITFDTDDGSIIVDLTIAEGAVIPKPPNPTKELHSFDGWFKDADLTELWDFDTDTITNSITLFAKWARVSYQVTFNPNGGTGSMAAINFNTGTAGLLLPVNDENITRGGYHFICWNTEPDRSGEEHRQGSWIDLNDSDVTIYAQWYVDYSVGDVGPSGGRIFYKKHLPIFSYPEWMYLEAAPSGFETTDLSWGNAFVSTNSPYPTSTTVGTGFENTQLIINILTDGTYAAHYCNNLSIGDVFNDWFLPSEGDLRAMLRELHCKSLGNFEDKKTYLSSSENFFVLHQVTHYDTNARAIYFDKTKDNPLHSVVSKTNTTLKIRPVRRF